MTKQPAIYIMASQRNGTLYIGVTSALVQRVWQHREAATPGLTTAILREKELKAGSRAKSWP